MLVNILLPVVNSFTKVVECLRTFDAQRQVRIPLHGFCVLRLDICRCILSDDICLQVPVANSFAKELGDYCVADFKLRVRF